MIFEKPIVFFDVETTGVSVATDRIVELYCKKLIPIEGNTPDSSFKFEELHFYFNPTITIPQSAIDIHGLTNEFLIEKPTFRDKARYIYSFIQGCDLSGFNIIRFDIPILVEELIRSNVDVDLSNARIFDPFIIYSKQYPRDLQTVYKHYRGVTFTNAHAARHDVEATIDILFEQIDVHSEISGDPDKLDKYCKGDVEYADYDQRIYKDSFGEFYYAFGKANGVAVKKDPGFGKWMLEQSFITLSTKRILRKILNS